MTAILETTCSWPTEAQTEATAQALARCSTLFPALVALEGGLGAGKTTFVRYLLRALGVQGRIKSPSYAVVESYETATGPVHHFDFYRFDDPREWEDAGFRDMLDGPGLKLVEWPDKAPGLLPVVDLRLSLAGQDVRQVHLEALTPRGAQLLEAVQS
ncbi:tRNA (adenosine(37)-N6)-threonylcarbamoyltransferase complex ATPase subunit type 1 TsaE [Inhella gelatinilytica]|uniref:tRNA threonylcarbamoyladenosine biosynthesis protein TsaE n=1 Tax=Inhella gelatinilytica TaxID=2795030 RepID=A0A931NE95_9BURK|nr:tRNA (adenosine(37)-N6)-threonylcarbamoyltransferase complex ATPase subunit type 1 TsaE [Inhella gelatinilytica]MBH9553025.1 tRNA (adenosine(37)-N6)-threonylcarbamoyltransferase complex ATPase subunit type 1 TsaE [Inhella gelatinilytica]